MKSKYKMFNLRLDGLFGRISTGDDPSQANMLSTWQHQWEHTDANFPSPSLVPLVTTHSSPIWAPGRASFSHSLLLLKASKAPLISMLSMWPQKQVGKQATTFLNTGAIRETSILQLRKKQHRENKTNKPSVNLPSKKSSCFLPRASKTTISYCCTNVCSCISYFLNIIISEWNIISHCNKL